MIPLDVTPVPASSLDRLRVIVVERGLRGAVGREMRVWRDSVSRRDLNQTPPAALFHRRSKGMDQSNRGDRVLMVVVDPFLKGGVEPRVVGLLSGIADVIHEDIDAVESRFSPLNNSIRSILGRYIAKNKFRLAANLTDFLRNGCCPIRTPAVDDDADTFTGQDTRGLCTNPGSAPCDKRTLSFNNISMFTTL